MVYSHEVQEMCCVAKGANHPSAPIPEEGKWVQASLTALVTALLNKALANFHST